MSSCEEKSKGYSICGFIEDDNLMVGQPEAIDEALMALKEDVLVLKVAEELQHYLSRKLKFLSDKKKSRLEQPHLIESLEMNFNDQVKKV